MQDRLPRYRREPQRLKSKPHIIKLTATSVGLISLIERYRFLPPSMITRLLTGSPRVIERHLQALFHKGYINRFAFPRIGNPGEFIYYLDHRKALDLLVEHGADAERLDWNLIANNASKNYFEINFGNRIDDMQGRLMHLHHEIMIARFHAALELGCRHSAGKVELSQWQQGTSLWREVYAPKLTVENGQLLESARDTERIPHRPDAFFTLRFPGSDKESLHFFYEADRKKTNTTRMNRKLRGHFHYVVKQKKHEAEYGIKRIRAVLIETTDMYWAQSLREAAASPVVSGSKPSPLFWFTPSQTFTAEQEVTEYNRTRRIPLFLLKPEVIFRKVWAAPADDTFLSLLD